MRNETHSKIKRFVGFFAFTLLAYTAVAQQYSVTGGAKDPYLAVDYTSQKLKVYLVYGMDNLRISYTSSSSEHQWYRYKTRAIDSPEKVSSTQVGTTSFITSVEEGYGYFVGEQENIAMNHFVWIIDYSKKEFDIRSLSISQNVDQCVAIRFDGDADINDMIYVAPVSGAQEKVKREFEVSYETVTWNVELGQFFPESVKEKFSGDLFSTTFDPPLADTEITLTGDMFARHFGVEKSISTSYQAKAIKVYADTTVVSSGSGNSSGAGEGELQAPAIVRFRALANVPVASLFMWKIYKDDDQENPIAQFSGEEIEYTFNLAGSFTAKLDVSDRTGKCTNEGEGHEFKISITETEMVVPNAFSPGTTPGINDIFKVRYKSVIKFQGWVFNRWGNELFHWTDPAQGWDGKYRGKYVPPGAYYYLIEYTGTDGKKRTKKGDINVFRSKIIDTEIPTE